MAIYKPYFPSQRKPFRLFINYYFIILNAQFTVYVLLHKGNLLLPTLICDYFFKSANEYSIS